LHPADPLRPAFVVWRDTTAALIPVESFCSFLLPTSAARATRHDGKTTSTTPAEESRASL
jgi:hypothetical protein